MDGSQRYDATEEVITALGMANSIRDRLGSAREGFKMGPEGDALAKVNLLTAKDAAQRLYQRIELALSKFEGYKP